MWFENDFPSVLVHSHSRTQATFPKLCACLSVTQHCGVASCPVIVNLPNLLLEKTAPLLQLMMDICLMLSQAHFWEFLEIFQIEAISFQKI